MSGMIWECSKACGASLNLSTGMISGNDPGCQHDFKPSGTPGGPSLSPVAHSSSPKPVVETAPPYLTECGAFDNLEKLRDLTEQFIEKYKQDGKQLVANNAAAQQSINETFAAVATAMAQRRTEMLEALRERYEEREALITENRVSLEDHLRRVNATMEELKLAFNQEKRTREREKSTVGSANAVQEATPKIHDIPLRLEFDQTIRFRSAIQTAAMLGDVLFTDVKTGQRHIRDYRHCGLVNDGSMPIKQPLGASNSYPSVAEPLGDRKGPGSHPGYGSGPLDAPLVRQADDEKMPMPKEIKVPKAKYEPGVGLNIEFMLIFDENNTEREDIKTEVRILHAFNGNPVFDGVIPAERTRNFQRRARYNVVVNQALPQAKVQVFFRVFREVQGMLLYLDENYTQANDTEVTEVMLPHQQPAQPYQAGKGGSASPAAYGSPHANGAADGAPVNMPKRLNFFINVSGTGKKKRAIIPTDGLTWEGFLDAVSKKAYEKSTNIIMTLDDGRSTRVTSLAQAAALTTKTIVFVSEA